MIIVSRLCQRGWRILSPSKRTKQWRLQASYDSYSHTIPANASSTVMFARHSPAAKKRSRDFVLEFPSKDNDTSEVMHPEYNPELLPFRRNEYLLQFCKDIYSSEDKPMATHEWETVISNIRLSNPRERQTWVLPFVHLLCSAGHTNRAHSLYVYFKTVEHRPKIAVGAMIMSLCAGLPVVDVTMITDLREELKDYVDVMPQGILKHYLIGLSATSNYRDVLDYIDAMGQSFTVLYTLGASTIRNNDSNTLKLVLERIRSMSVPIHVHSTKMGMIYRAAYDSPNPEHLRNVYDMMKDKGLPLTSDSVDAAIEYYRRKGWHVTKTELNKHGICENCGYKILQASAFSESDFDNLRKAFIERAIVKGDIFLNSTPAELKRFLSYLDMCPPYDVVLDGLNVAHLSQSNKSLQLKRVVEHLRENEMKVLVFGRNHMNKWRDGNMDFVKKHASLYLISNMSQDDPYLLYAALHKGRDCFVVSRDMMRNHVHELGPELGEAFMAWQRSRQIIVYRRNERPLLQMPPTYKTVLEETDTNIHIPCNSERKSEHYKFHADNNWLCVQKGQSDVPS